MATRSKIAIENEDGTVTAIYCHWDGYVENNGKLLFTHYRNREKVKRLIELGAISSLGAILEAPEGHSFSSPVEGVTVAYHRDRDDNLRVEQNKSIDDFFNGDFESYGYLYNLEGEWLVKRAYSGGGVKKLDRVIKGLDEL